MDDLVERAQNYVKVSTSCGNATGRPNNIVTITTELLARITELETSLAEAEGRVIAEVVAWLRNACHEGSLADDLASGEWEK